MEKEKEKELCMMEHELNTTWVEIEKKLLKDSKMAKYVMVEGMMAIDVLSKLDLISSKMLLAWAALKLLQEARRNDIIPEQRMTGENNETFIP